MKHIHLLIVISLVWAVAILAIAVAPACIHQEDSTEVYRHEAGTGPCMSSIHHIANWSSTTGETTVSPASEAEKCVCDPNDWPNDWDPDDEE